MTDEKLWPPDREPEGAPGNICAQCGGDGAESWTEEAGMSGRLLHCRNCPPPGYVKREEAPTVPEVGSWWRDKSVKPEIPRQVVGISATDGVFFKPGYAGASAQDRFSEIMEPCDPPDTEAAAEPDFPANGSKWRAWGRISAAEVIGSETFPEPTVVYRWVDDDLEGPYPRMALCEWREKMRQLPRVNNRREETEMSDEHESHFFLTWDQHQWMLAQIKKTNRKTARRSWVKRQLWQLTIPAAIVGAWEASPFAWAMIDAYARQQGIW